METVDVRDLVFVDECGVHVAMTPTHGWTPRGSRAVDSVPRNRGRVRTVLGAMDMDGMLGLYSIDAATTTDVFLDFLRTAVLPDLPRGKTLVLDNLGAHRAKRVWELCSSHGIHLKFLPPYSPEFNPIEHAWAWFKHYIRKQKPRTRDDLDEVVETLFHELPPAHAQAWILHDGYPEAQ
jgi:transposase